jgi:hypothetical protein
MRHRLRLARERRGHRAKQKLALHLRHVGELGGRHKAARLQLFCHLRSNAGAGRKRSAAASQRTEVGAHPTADKPDRDHSRREYHDGGNDKSQVHLQQRLVHPSRTS